LYERVHFLFNLLYYFIKIIIIINNINIIKFSKTDIIIIIINLYN